MLMISAVSGQEAALRFSGYEWIASEAPEGKAPGPNPFRNSPRTIDLDERGRLRLAVDLVDGKWSCAELRLDRPLGYGTYEVGISGDLSRLDPQAVFGFFTYDHLAPPHHGEIDIEFAKWGDREHPGGNLTVQPYDTPGNTFLFSTAAAPGVTVCRFLWRKEGVDFLVLFREGPAERVLARWRKEISIPPGEATLHLNLWLFQGRPPLSGRRQSVRVEYFSFSADSEI